MLSSNSIMERHQSLLVELDSALRSLQTDASTRIDERYRLASVIEDGSRPVNVVSEDLWRIIVTLQAAFRDGLRRSARGVLGPFVPLKAEGAVSFWPYLRSLLPKRTTCLVDEAEPMLRDDLDRELATIVQALNEGTIAQLIASVAEDATMKQQYYSSSGRAAVLDRAFLQELHAIVADISLIWFEVELEEVLSIRSELERLCLDEEVDESRIVEMTTAEPAMGADCTARGIADPLRAAIPVEPVVEPPPLEDRRQSVFERMKESLFAIIGPEIFPEGIDDLSSASTATSMERTAEEQRAAGEHQTGEGLGTEEGQAARSDGSAEAPEGREQAAHAEQENESLDDDIEEASEANDQPASAVRSQSSDSLPEGHPLRQSLRASKQLSRRPSLLDVLDEGSVAPGATNRVSIVMQALQPRVQQ